MFAAVQLVQMPLEGKMFFFFSFFLFYWFALRKKRFPDVKAVILRQRSDSLPLSCPPLYGSLQLQPADSSLPA